MKAKYNNVANAQLIVSKQYTICSAYSTKYMFSQFYTLEVEPMVTTVTIMFGGFQSQFVSAFSSQICCFALDVFLRVLFVQKGAFDLIKLTHTSQLNNVRL